jgi:hypothetical protein
LPRFKRPQAFSIIQKTSNKTNGNQITIYRSCSARDGCGAEKR